MLKLAQIAKTNQRMQKTNLKISLDQIAVLFKGFSTKTVTFSDSESCKWLSTLTQKSNRKWHETISKQTQNLQISDSESHGRLPKKNHKETKNCRLQFFAVDPWERINTNEHKLRTLNWIKHKKIACGLEVNRHKKWAQSGLGFESTQRKEKLYKITIAESKVGLKERKDCGLRKAINTNVDSWRESTQSTKGRTRVWINAEKLKWNSFLKRTQHTKIAVDSGRESTQSQTRKLLVRTLVWIDAQMKWNFFLKETQHKKWLHENWLRKLIYTIWCGFGFESTHKKKCTRKMKLICNFNAMKWLIFWSKIDRVHSNQLNTQRCTMHKMIDWQCRALSPSENSNSSKTQNGDKRRQMIGCNDLSPTKWCDDK